MKKTNLIIFLILCAAALLVAGYATFAQPLATYISQSSKWDIEFTDAKRVEIKGNTKELTKVDYRGNTATFNISLTSSGDSITYDFTIKNKGDLTAKVESIYIIPENKATDAILFSTHGLEVGDVLEPGESTNLMVSAVFNSSQKSISGNDKKEVTIIVNYVQK